MELQKAAAERAAERKGQVGSGDRSDRIRTYNVPQNRISDHRINWTSYDLDRYLMGHMETVQEAMIDNAKLELLETWDGSQLKRCSGKAIHRLLLYAAQGC